MNQPSLSVSGVAHDLNNQIMILFNSLDRMRSDLPEVAELDIALKAAERCAELTSQLLPGKPQDSTGFISVRELISETVMLLRSVAPVSCRVELDCRAESRVPASYAELSQALMNLCLNAMQAIDGPGVIRIVVTAEPGFLLVSVSDTGPGILPAIAERMFEPLFTTRAQCGGHGLGLSRVREIVHRLRGDVLFQNLVPHGAWFRMRLPLANPSVTLELAHLSD